MSHKLPMIAVAMSGGVDSSVAAALLAREGYQVVGLFAKTWTPQPGDGTTCTWVADRRDALRVAAHLGIPLITINLETTYRERVIEPLFRGYASGVTPNPDVLCNQVVKFGKLYEAARALGAELFATGHYARLEPTEQSDQLPQLLRGLDPEKDQSYFLWDIPPAVLGTVRFPIGHLPKTKVRQLARRLGLPVAQKKDSQGICFLGQTDLATFLSQRLPAKPGPVIDRLSGQVLGTHPGVQFFTIGQRHGLGNLQHPDSNNILPKYITQLDVEANVVMVGPKADLFAHQIRTMAPHWLDATSQCVFEHGGSVRVVAQVRYQQKPVPALVTRLGKTRAEVLFDEPVYAPTPGQSVVLYSGDHLLGGMVIRDVSNHRSKPVHTFAKQRTG